jgi:hypothetical protein
MKRTKKGLLQGFEPETLSGNSVEVTIMLLKCFHEEVSNFLF